MKLRALPVAAFALVLGLVVAAAGSGPQKSSRKQAEPESDQSADLKAINDLTERDIAASKENDVDTLASLWTQDGVLIVPMSPPFVGKPAIRKLLEHQKEQARDAETTAYDEQWEELRIIGDYAYEWGSISATIELSGGKQVSHTVGAMRILQKQKDGEWLVARAIVTPGAK
jgi:uncharacterized protein (TIGR02246 family)